MKRKKINDISEIWDGKKLLIKDFSNLDLSSLDLRNIPKESWYDCIFYNTDFSNTNIKFVPSKLFRTIVDSSFFGMLDNVVSMKNCIFDNCDLSYIKNDDLVNVFYDGCSFRNTNFHPFKYLVDVIVDDFYLKQDFDYFDEFKDCNSFIIVDINTIRKNPDLKVPSYLILNAIMRYLYNIEKKELQFIDGARTKMSIKRKEELVKEAENILKYDKQGYLKRMYEKLKQVMDINQRYDFFKRKIKDLHIKDVKVEDFPISLLSVLEFSHNEFDNVEVDNPLSDLLIPDSYFLYDFGDDKNIYTKLYLPSVKYDSWQENKYAQRRIANGSISFLTKVYVELSRLCNGRCEFCRNSSFDKCNYNLEMIKSTLEKIQNYVNIVVFGGGEPTLKLDDVKKICDYFDKKVDFHMFTNGSNPKIIDDDYVMNNLKINLSRHSIDDVKNSKIFKISPINMMTKKDIEKLASKNPDMTLAATCFNGGLDNLEDIILYIKFAKEIGVKKVSFNDLHKDNSMGSKNIYSSNLNIDPKVFDDLINYLKENDFRNKFPIYATGGYVSYVFKDKDGFSVAVQNYITKKELDDAWPYAIKRTFDLSIDPSGNLYENWHQQSNPVKSIGKKGKKL